MNTIAQIIKQISPINDWSILAYAGVDRKERSVWAKCKCGTVRRVKWRNIKSQKSIGCGCRRPFGHIEHGMSSINGKPTPEYKSWSKMLARASDRRKCQNDVIKKRYRDRGIKVCEEFHDFLKFLAHIGPKPTPTHTLDRIDNNRGYEIGNVRWISQAEQNRNTSANHLVNIEGVTKCISQWIRDLNLSNTTVMRRIRQGWSDVDALTIKPRQRNPTNGKPVRAGMFSVN